MTEQAVIITLIITLGLLALFLCGWALILDTRIEQLEGYIKRIQREAEEARRIQ